MAAGQESPGMQTRALSMTHQQPKSYSALILNTAQTQIKSISSNMYSTRSANLSLEKDREHCTGG